MQRNRLETQRYAKEWQGVEMRSTAKDQPRSATRSNGLAQIRDAMERKCPIRRSGEKAQNSSDQRRRAAPRISFGMRR